MAPPLPTPRPTFDPYHSSATGHQRADNRLAASPAWRSSRTLKLSHQFRAGPAGGPRITDTVGAGSPAFARDDGRTHTGAREPRAPPLRPTGERDIRAAMAEPARKRRRLKGAKDEQTQTQKACGTPTVVAAHASDSTAQIPPLPADSAPAPPLPQIFANTTVYINGCTAPLVGDHMLKRLLVQRGATLCLALARRDVTHVILGRPNNGPEGGRGGRKGCGGGLAARKIQKEIVRVGGCGVRFVGVEWVLESIKAGRRLSEARFSTLNTAGCGQASVLGLLTRGRDGDAGALALPGAETGM